MLCTLFVFTGCDEIMSSLDNPVNSYLQLKQASVTIYRGQSFKMSDYYSTISDAKPVFTSADEKIALVDENGVVTGANRGKTKITVEIPATPYYNAATAEFEVEVDALLNLPKDAKEFALNEEYNLGVTSVSTGAITYKSSDTKVATVDANGNVTAKGYGDATITISIAATPQYDRTETAEFAAKVRVLTEAELNAIINTAAAGDGKVQVMLKDGFELENDLNLGDKKISLDLMNSIMTVKGDKSIIVANDFALKNAKFDLTGSKIQLIQLNMDDDLRATLTKNQAVYPSANTSGQKDYCYIKDFSLENVWVKNLKSDLISDRNKKWAIDNLTIKNCIVQANYTGSSSSVLWFNSSSEHNMNIEGNIFYNIYEDKTKGTQRFISCASSSNAIKVWGTTAKGDGTPESPGSKIVWKFNDNICINVGYNKFGNNVPNSANNMNMEGNNNIFYNVVQIYQFFTGSAVKTTTGNKIWCPNITLNTTDITRTDSNGNKLAVEEDPGITAPTEPLDLVNGVVVK
jgi:hypothetical protein